MKNRLSLWTMKLVHSANELAGPKPSIQNPEPLLAENLSLWTKSILKIGTKISIDTGVNPQFKTRDSRFKLFMKYLKASGYNSSIISYEIMGKYRAAHQILTDKKVDLDIIFQCFQPIPDECAGKIKTDITVTLYDEYGTPGPWGILKYCNGGIYRSRTMDTRSDNAWTVIEP